MRPSALSLTHQWGRKTGRLGERRLELESQKMTCCQSVAPTQPSSILRGVVGDNEDGVFDRAARFAVQLLSNNAASLACRVRV